METKAPKFYFDYIFYRMTKAYYRWDGKNGLTSIMGITMIQLFLIMDFVLIISRLIFTRDELKGFIPIGKFIILAVFVAILITNHIFYRGKYDDLHTYWMNEDKSKKRMRGILVVLSLIFPWIPILILGIFF